MFELLCFVVCFRDFTLFVNFLHDISQNEQLAHMFQPFPVCLAWTLGCGWILATARNKKLSWLSRSKSIWSNNSLSVWDQKLSVHAGFCLGGDLYLIFNSNMHAVEKRGTVYHTPRGCSEAIDRIECPHVWYQSRPNRQGNSSKSSMQQVSSRVPSWAPMWWDWIPFHVWY